MWATGAGRSLHFKKRPMVKDQGSTTHLLSKAVVLKLLVETYSEVLKSISGNQHLKRNRKTVNVFCVTSFWIHPCMSVRCMYVLTLWVQYISDCRPELRSWKSSGLRGVSITSWTLHSSSHPLAKCQITPALISTSTQPEKEARLSFFVPNGQEWQLLFCL
jgi:hypothetical protein